MTKKVVKEVEEVEENVKEEEIKKETLSNDYEEITLEERVVSIEKKVKASFWLNIVTLVLVVFLLILLLGGGNATTETDSGSGSGSGSDANTQQTTSYDTSAFKTITPADIKNESKGKTIVVWIGRQSCGYCAAYAPYMAEAANNYGIKAYYIDLATMVNFEVSQPYITDEKAFNTLNSLTGSGEWKDFASKKLGGTPLTLIIKNNKVVGGLSGARSTSDIESAFKAAGLKKSK